MTPEAIAAMIAAYDWCAQNVEGDACERYRKGLAADILTALETKYPAV